MLINRARAFYERTATLRENRLKGYAFALATVALALVARFMLAGHSGGFPFLTFIPAILLTSFICGWRAGAVAAILGTAARWYFIGPVGAHDVLTPPSALGFGMYAFAVLIILTAVGAMHLAFRDFAQSEKQREHLNEGWRSVFGSGPKRSKRPTSASATRQHRVPPPRRKSDKCRRWRRWAS